MLVESEDLPALLRMAQEEPQDGAIGRVGDGQPDDPDLGTLKLAVDLEQLAHAVLEEYRELSHRRPASTMHRFQFDFAAAIVLPEIHEIPHGGQLSLVDAPRTASWESLIFSTEPGQWCA